MHRARLDIDGHDGLMRLLALGECPTSDNFDRINLFVAGIVDLARRDLGIDRDRSFVLVHDDAGRFRGEGGHREREDNEQGGDGAFAEEHGVLRWSLEP